MNLLWLTLADPDPATNGQLVYSKGLIEATLAAGARLQVLGLRRDGKDAPQDTPDMEWRLYPGERLPRWRRPLSPLPEAGLRAHSSAARRALATALARGGWDAVIVDSICAGWALGDVVEHRRTAERPPALVYIAHNHEITVARSIARQARGPRRLIKAFDALKVMRLERRLVAEAGLVTSNTPEDCRKFAAEADVPPVAFLPPGYGGSRVASRVIDAEIPRRAVVVGSFDWPPKRASLERFLADAVSILARGAVELQIVGTVEPGYRDDLRRRFPSVEFVGPVDDVRPFMARARIALVPDLLGGFKLKGLDYAFNRIPILSMRTALPGMPLVDGISIGLFDSHARLAEEVIALIDDFAVLNARQERAFAACTDRFDWLRIGRHLLARIARAARPVTEWRDAPTSAAAYRPVRRAGGK